ncbi:MAG TPA: tRNA epoxyqueuosine(34) reductase QueG [Kofleriaceae bacterium]|nr:tRNA epoxyqueuosine(34) reductase QueG [Kofleriaceae bacterium]
MEPDPVAARDAAVALARRHGFHRVGIVPVEPSRRHELYRAWLAAGRHGEMAYLASPEQVAARADPRALVAGARTVLVAAIAYGGDPGAVPADRLRGTIARYARGTDYHLVVRDRLRALADDLAAALGRPIGARPCVDAAPLAERELAEQAGLGFVAKNTMVIAPGLGSYVLLGELLLDVELAATEAPVQRSRCGACRACLDACPTGAFVDAFVLDARRCISYLTIEHDGPIPRELRAAIGDRIFGCDVCQEVCPWNAAAPDRAAPAAELTARDADHAHPDLLALAAIGANQLRRFVRRTALRRIDRARLLRNVAVALGNSRDPRAVPALLSLVAHAVPLVRGHAAWALAELAAGGTTDAATIAAALDRARATEPDAAARAELDDAAARLASLQGAGAAGGIVIT